MPLSDELVSQFVKATKDSTKASTESTVYGTIVEYNGKNYVKLDGSDLLTPYSQTADVNPGERVTIMIKDHTATITGNITSPTTHPKVVESIGNRVTTIEADYAKFTELEAETARITNLFAENAEIKKLFANYATIEKLEAEYAKIETLEAEYAKIAKLEAEYATIEKLEAESADIKKLFAGYAEIDHLHAEYATIDLLDAERARIAKLEADHAIIENLDTTYANIDFSNIGIAAIKELFSDSGIIKDLVVSDSKITGELVGVTLRGDLITAGTIKADKLVVKGSDGIYYKLNMEAGAVASTEVAEEELQNGLHGSAIIAKTITAEQIAVDDLVAFDATIGGFNITSADAETGACASIHSFAKTSADSGVKGIYLGSDGQMAIGDATNFLKYYKDTDGKYKLDISAASMKFSTGKTVEQVIEEATDIEVGARNLIRNSTNLLFEDYYFTNEDLVVTHDGEGNVTWVSPAVSIVEHDNGDVIVVSQDITVTDDSAGNVSIST